MALRRKLVHWRGYRVVVSEASVMMGLERQRLVTEAKLDELPVELQLLAVSSYPDCISCVIEHQGFEEWPVSFEVWGNEIPNKFVKQWEDAVYELNPHWLPQLSATKEQQRQDADELHRRLTARHKERLDAARQAPELPDAIPLNNVELSYRVWQRMEATGWRYLPSQLLNEPDWLMDDILVISSQDQIVEDLLKE